MAFLQGGPSTRRLLSTHTLSPVHCRPVKHDGVIKALRMARLTCRPATTSRAAAPSFNMHSFSRKLLPLLSCLPGLLPAQEQNNTVSPPDASPTVRLEPCVVTSPSAGTPCSVSLDPRAPVQPMPAHDGADLLKTIPGFSVIRKGGTDGDPVLRGMAGSRLGILMEDQCLYGGCGNRMDPPTAYVFPNAYDRVTVIKGPQTVVHGPGNSAGVVLFERALKRSAAPEHSLQAAVTGASFGRADGFVDAHTANPLLKVRGTGTFTRADDYQDGQGRSVHSRHERWSTNASLLWTPDSKTFIELSGALSDGEAAYADRAMDGVKFARENLGVRLRREQLAPWWVAMEMRVYHNDIDHVMDNYSLRSFTPSAMMPGKAVSNPDRRTRGAVTQAEFQPARDLLVKAGLDAQDNRHRVRTTSNQETTPYEAKARVSDGKFSQRGAFCEAIWSLAQGTRLVGGARADRWKALDQRPQITLPMISSVANPTAGWERRDTLESGFARLEHDAKVGGLTVSTFVGGGLARRFPDYWELVRNESISSVSAFGARPETTRQLDAGLTIKTTKLDVSLALFAASIDDFLLVQSAYAKASGLTGTRMATVTRNIEASTRGGEVTASWRPVVHWKVDLSAAHVHGDNDTDRRALAQLPPLEGRLALTYAKATWSAGGLLRCAAAQRRYSTNQGNIVGQDLGPTAGFTVLSIHAARNLAKHWRLSGGVDNMLDKTYAEHISRAGAAVAGYTQSTRVNEPGRVFWVRIDASY